MKDASCTRWHTARKLLVGDSGSRGLKDELEETRRGDKGLLLRMMVAGGVVSGLIAYVFNSTIECTLELVWSTLPRLLEAYVSDTRYSDVILDYGWVYTVVCGVTMGTLAGLSIYLLGYPGDLPNVIHCIHSYGYVPLCQAPSMFLCSLFSIVAGGSLGPEAPLVLICAAVCGWLGQALELSPRSVRNFSIIGASAGLSAFFGVVLGGALFGLEVMHRSGLEFHEVGVHTVGAGCVACVIFRWLNGTSFGSIWDYEDIPHAQAADVVVGAVLGIIAAMIGLLFGSFTRHLGRLVNWMGFGSFEDRYAKHPVLLAAIGGVCVSVIGILVPPTMFWSEFEMKSVADPSVKLEHIFPKGGIWGGTHPFLWWADISTAATATVSPWIYVLVGFTKLVAISCTVQSGFRGGFIFPLFFAGACFGKAIAAVTGIPTVIACMCLSAGLNVSITRTPFATTLILSMLSGQPSVTVPCLAASLVALLLTDNHVFIHVQRRRADIAFVTSPAFVKPWSDVIHGEHQYHDVGGGGTAAVDDEEGEGGDAESGVIVGTEAGGLEYYASRVAGGAYIGDKSGKGGKIHHDDDDDDDDDEESGDIMVTGSIDDVKGGHLVTDPSSSSFPFSRFMSSMAGSSPNTSTGTASLSSSNRSSADTHTSGVTSGCDADGGRLHGHGTCTNTNNTNASTTTALRENEAEADCHGVRYGSV